MNLNYFVVVPSKTTSSKMKGRHVPALQLDAVQLDQESKIIESRLQQLREDMSREKEEREKSGGFRWKSVKAASHGANKSKENSFQKLSAGKVKMRVLKAEPEEAGRPMGKAPRPPPVEQPASRKPRLKGKPCGQCEARAARLMCAECGEDYCVGCFARFHQKGALKNHRMIPFQMEIQTSISTLDVVSQFKRQIEPEGSAASSKWKEVKWGQGAPKNKSGPMTLPPAQPYPLVSQVFAHEDGKEEGEEGEHQGGRMDLLSGVFDEGESERSFQEALMEWRKGREVLEPEEEHRPETKPQSEPEPGPEQEPDLEADPEPDWGLPENLKVSTEVFAAQADLVQERLPVSVEFKEHGLSYMERLLVKKHRRTPIEEYRPPLSASSYQESQMDTSRLTDEEGPALTAEELEMQQYCASLFATAATPTSPSTCSSSSSSSSSSKSSDQCEHPTKSCLTMVELEQMSGDSAVLNNTLPAELEMDNGVVSEAEGMPMIIGQGLELQEPKRGLSSSPRSSMSFTHLPRPPASAPSALKCGSPVTRSLYSPSPPASMSPFPSARASKCRSARMTIGPLQTRQDSTKISQSAPCGIGPNQSSITLSLFLPTPESFTSKSTSSAEPERTSWSKTPGSSLPTPLSHRSKSQGLPPPEPKSPLSEPSSRNELPRSPPLNINFRPKSIASSSRTPKSCEVNLRESPPPELSSRSRSPESPLPTESPDFLPPDLNSRNDSPQSPSLNINFRSKSTGSSTPTPKSYGDKLPDSPPPELSSRSRSPESPLPTESPDFLPPELNSRNDSPQSPSLNINFRSKSTGSSTPTPKSYGDKYPESPSPERTSWSKLPESPLPELTTRDESSGSPPPEIGFRPESTVTSSPTPIAYRDTPPETPPPVLLSGRKFPESPWPELNSRGESPKSPSLNINFRSESTQSLSPAPKSYRDKSPESPQPELPPRSKSQESPVPERNSRSESPRSPSLKINYRSESTGSSSPTPKPFRESPESASPEMTSRDKSICSSPPTAPSRRDESPELPLSELNPRDKSAEFLKPELNSRDESPGLPPPEINLGCNSTGSSPPTPISDRDKSPDSPLPGLNSRAESPESPRPLITYKSRSTRSPPLTPLSSRTRSPQSPPFELSPTSLLMGSPQRPTSPETLLSVRSPRPAHPSSETHSVLAKPPPSPSLMKQASARPLHPTLLSKQWRSNQSSISSEAAASGETSSRGLELLPCRGDTPDEEVNGSTPVAPFVSRAAAASGSDSHPDFDQEMTDKPYFISDPSLALYSLARCSDRYPGLDGFLTLGLDPSPNSDSSNPLPADVSRVCENPTERLVGGPECWRPGSSLRECADDHLVTDIMSSRLFGSPSPVSRSSQAASPTKKMGFSGGTEARPRSGRNTPRSARPVSAGLSPQATPWASPQPRPQSSPWPRPRSRAAQEIQEIECVARGDIEDQLLEEEADLLALASLEKELRRMSGKGTALGDPQGVSPPYPRAEVETRRVRGGPKRQESSEGHTDEEEEICRDKQNVMSLP